jgi:hypothetical protein
MMPDEFDWAAHTKAVVVDIFGEPNTEMSRPPDDVRFGNHGSVSVNYTTGQWYDFENERGGGIKELIHLYKGIDDRDAAIAYAEECQQNFENGGQRRSNGKDDEPYQQVVEATYPYCDMSGQVAFEVVRFVFKRIDGSYVTDARGKRKKTFSQRRPSGESDQSWLWGLEAGEFMRPAPGGNWARFNTTKFEQYPLSPGQPQVQPGAAAAGAAGAATPGFTWKKRKSFNYQHIRLKCSRCSRCSRGPRAKNLSRA